MPGTAVLTTDPVAPPARSSKPTFGDMNVRLAGIGALGFVGIVAMQNVIRGASAPANDASSTEVLASYADHRAVTFALIAMFVVSGASLAVFLGGAMRRLTTSSRPAWAYTGYVGGIGILAVFSALVGCEQALSVAASGSHPDPSAIAALWALHNSIFTVLFLSIAVALLGLSRAGVAAGITPRAFEWIAPVGSVLLAVACAAGPAVAAGDAMPFFGLGLIGFLTWLAFLAATGLRLVRSGTDAPIQAIQA